MKSLIFVLSLASVTTAFAGIEGKYKLSSGKTSGYCPASLEIIREGATAVRIKTFQLESPLANAFNTDSDLQDLVITGINEGTEVVKSKNSSHGQTHKTKRNSIERGNSLRVEYQDKESFGIIPVSEFNGTLILAKSGSSLSLSVDIAYDEKMSSDNDYTLVEKCLYK